MMEGPKDDCVLSEDNIYEILLRVALSSLPSCLNVCRSWRRIGFEPHFDAARSLHSKIASGFILQTIRLNKNYYHFLSMHRWYDDPLPISIASFLPCRSKNLFIEATAPIHGLILCIKYRKISTKPPRFYVTRLATTAHHLLIPNPKTRFFTEGTALISNTYNINHNTCDFKIVRISEPRWSYNAKRTHLICEVFDSVAQKWTRCNDIPYFMLYNRAGLVIKQTTFWIVYQLYALDIYNHDFFPNSIFAFNVDEESGRIIMGPEAMYNTTYSSWKWRMMPCEERLCMVHISNEDIFVWMMNVEEANENIQRWEWKGSFSKQYIINHIFAFEDDIHDEKLVLLETLYRELWFELIGRDLVNILDLPKSVFRMHLESIFVTQLTSSK